MRKMFKRYIIEYRWVAAATLLFWILLVFVPMHGSDYIYSRQMLSAAEIENPFTGYFMMSGDELTTIPQWFTSAKNHYLYHDNGRLANFLAMGQGIIPHWIYDLLIAASYAVLLTMLLNISGQSRKSAGAVAAMALAIWWFFNWDAPMLSVDYQLNYLFSAAVVMCLVWAVIQSDCRITPGMIILALVAGMSHESFSASFSAALLFWLLFNRRKITRPQLIICLTFFAGTAFAVFSPALMSRTFYALTSDTSVIARFKPLVRDNIILPLTIIALLFNGRRKNPLRKPEGYILGIAAVAAMVIFLFSNSFPRALRPEQTALTALFFICIKPQWLSKRAVAVSLWTVLIIWSASLLYWNKIMEQDFKYLESTDEEVIYHDFHTFADTPLWLGMIPSGPGTNPEGLQSTVGGYRHVKSSYMDEIVFFPSVMADNDTSMVIPGTAGLRGRFPFFIASNRLPEGIDIEITFGPADILRCKNPMVMIFGILTGKLFSQITTPVSFNKKRDIIINNDTFGVYSNALWYLGANDYARQIIKADTIAHKETDSNESAHY